MSTTTPNMKLTQGSLVAENPRRWIAVILDEQEIKEAVDAVRAEDESDIQYEDLDELGLRQIVRRYTDGLLSGGENWFEVLKEAVRSAS